MGIINDLKIYFRMLFNYKPKKFWNDLLSNSFDLRGVGHFRLSEEENEKMYAEKKEIINRELKNNNISINRDTLILEVGCGVGYWTEYIKSFDVKNYTGNDIAEISIINLQKLYPEYQFIHGDISEIMLPENSFDMCFMIDVTQHITDDDKFNLAMKNIWRSIKNGGYFILTRWDPEKNIYLSNKLRLNRIEKPRGLKSYISNFDNNYELLSDVDFNDKYLMIILKK